MAVASKSRNTHTAERPAACDLVRGNKAVDLFSRIKSQADGRSAPPRSAPLYVCFYPKSWVCSHFIAVIGGPAEGMVVSLLCLLCVVQVAPSMPSWWFVYRRATACVCLFMSDLGTSKPGGPNPSWTVALQKVYLPNKFNILMCVSPCIFYNSIEIIPTNAQIRFIWHKLAYMFRPSMAIIGALHNKNTESWEQDGTF